MNSAQRRGVVRCGVAALLFGASTPFAAQVAGDVGSLGLAGLLYVGAAAAVAPFVLSWPTTGPGRGASWRRGGGRLALAVVFGGALGPVLLMMGLDRTPAATASLLLNLELVATVVLAAVLFREHVGPGLAAGTVLVVAASVTLGWSASPDLRLGALLVAAACVCWGVDNCVTAGLDQLAPAQITFVKGVAAGGANLVLGVLSSGWPAAGAVVAGLAIGAIGYGVSITLWVAGARDLGAARGQLVFATAPFLGAAVAWVVLSEPFTARQLAAALLAACGVGFVLRSEHHHAHRHEPLDHDHEHTHDDDHHDHEHTHDDPQRRHRPSSPRRHRHRHRHGATVHAHPHVPDLHHRHEHQ